ncbi:MAG: tetratricopeptide repeat protein [Acidimicrobiales bacterium]
MKDVTDASFQVDVMERSAQVPVVMDLWAPWCGPCRTLGPILERVVGATGGAVELAKVNVDESPQIASAFRVQSIPAVYALSDGKVVDSFLGALPEAAVAEFVARLAPAPSVADLAVEAGDEASLRQALESEPDHPGAVVALAGLLVDRGETEEALGLLARVPESPEARRVAALARLGGEGGEATGDGDGTGIEARMDALLDRVKGDDQARQELVDLLETLGPEDPRTAGYRRALAARLY